MAYTLEQYEALKAAIAEGALMVRFADRSVTYRSIDEMIRILRLMESDLGLNTNSNGGRRFASFSKGF
ncbi:phage head-tail joining protein [Pseudomonas knackmussii]|uniref:phage head-tail joining protein n=1 Tax=Pseudomonas knackmussii TaxID=65741 RepID=UPI003BCE62A9